MYYLDNLNISSSSTGLFTLLSLEVFPETNENLLRVLKPGKFTFYTDITSETEDCRIFEDNFFLNNISVQAIVGQNGSGKSSVLDIIYRLINNVSHFLFLNIRQTSSSIPLAYVPGIYAKLDYLMDGKHCSLECRDMEMALRTPHISFRFGDDKEKNWHFFKCIYGKSIGEIKQVTPYLFYTIVTNYAFNSFITKDYAEETALNLFGTSWIDGIFHKNDGYKTPIVLNPFRHNGSLDVDRESDFTQTRSILLLNYFKKKRMQFIQGYDLHNVTYRFDPHSFFAHFRFALSKLQRSRLQEVSSKNPLDEQAEFESIILNKFKAYIRREGTIASLICNLYSVSLDNRDEIQQVACAYLVYKTLSILEKYDEFSQYVPYSNISLCFSTCTSLKIPYESLNESFKLAIAKIVKDKSHITYKVHQTLNFLELCEHEVRVRYFANEKFSLSNYSACFNRYRLRRFNNSINFLPPPIFKPQIWLDKTDERGRKVNEAPISMASLSAGEKLFLYTLSTIVYHIQNIKSVNANTVTYRCVNIIMDELELCFHPDMQRQFIMKLVTTISSLRFNDSMKFNLMLITHSPFILSDIPKHRILFLKDGQDCSSEMSVNPFATNINNILAQNFFLADKGFVGEYAQFIVSDLLKYYEGNQENVMVWTDEKAKFFIDNILGDPVIKEHLTIIHDLKANN